MINSRELKSILYLAFLAGSIFFLHYLLLDFFPVELYAPGILNAHPFLLTITVLSIIAAKIIFKKAKQTTFGYIYMATGLVKMFLSVFFLWPILKNDNIYKKEYVLQFFMIYFIYLVIEVIYLVQHNKNK